MQNRTMLSRKLVTKHTALKPTMPSASIMMDDDDASSVDDDDDDTSSTNDAVSIAILWCSVVWCGVCDEILSDFERMCD